MSEGSESEWVWEWECVRARSCLGLKSQREVFMRPCLSVGAYAWAPFPLEKSTHFVSHPCSSVPLKFKILTFLFQPTLEYKVTYSSMPLKFKILTFLFQPTLKHGVTHWSLLEKKMKYSFFRIRPCSSLLPYTPVYIPDSATPFFLHNSTLCLSFWVFFLALLITTYKIKEKIMSKCWNRLNQPKCILTSYMNEMLKRELREEIWVVSQLALWFNILYTLAWGTLNMTYVSLRVSEGDWSLELVKISINVWLQSLTIDLESPLSWMCDFYSSKW